MDLVRAIDHRCHLPLPSTNHRQLNASLNKYTYMRWIPCQVHKIHDFNAVFVHLYRITICLPKMVRTEHSASAVSRSYAVPGEVYIPTQTIMLS